MKFLQWLFNFSSRHSGDVRRYEKGKVSTKIIMMIVLLILASATLAIEYWCINLFNTKFWVGILVLIFILIPVGCATLENLIFYGYLGIKMFIFGAVGDILTKREKSKSKASKEVAGESVELATAEQNVSEQAENPAQTKNDVVATNDVQQQKDQKSHKWLDMLVAVMSILLAVGTVVGLFVLPSAS